MSGMTAAPWLRALALLALALVAILGASACRDTGHTTAPAGPPPSVTPPIEAGSAYPTAPARTSTAGASDSVRGGCGALPAGVAPGSTTVRALTSGGKAREYRLHYPAKAPTGALPVVLNWHGLGSNAAEQEAYSGLVPISDREGFILVSPDGLGTPRGFAAIPGVAGNADDVQFARDLLDALRADVCNDPTRVYSTGMSNGAFMSSRLGCELSDRIAAIAPVAGVSYPSVGHCGSAVPVLAFHGTNDLVVPFEAGLIFGVLPYQGARINIGQWAVHDELTACSGTSPGFQPLSEHARRESYNTCGGPSVSLVVVDGGGHTWPGAIPVITLGPTTTEISAAEMIWAFFKDFRLGR